MDGNSTSQASKRLATIVAVLTLALGLPTTRSQAAGVWTNEPAGASVVMDCPFNSVSGCGILDVYSSSQIISDGTAQVSASNVMKSTLYAGNSTGGMQLNYAIPKTYREMFVGLMWRTNPQFQGRSGGNKLFFMRGPDSIGVFVIQGGLSTGSGPLVWVHNSSSLNNSHVCSTDLGLLCYPNASSGLVQRGVWTKIEAYIKASTTNTSRDGIVRWWINGVLAGNYTNINYAGAGLNEWIWTETWDGCGSNLGCDLGQVNTVNWEHYVDHLRISIPNDSAGADNPPGPPISPTIRSVTTP